MTAFRTTRLLALLAASAPLLTGAARAQSTVPQQEMWVADKTVQDLTWLDETLYVAGEFTRVGPQTGGASPIDLATGELVPGFPVTNGAVYAVEPDGQGGWFIGGAFTTVGGLPRNRIARVRSDFTVDPAWDPNAENQVLGLLRVGDTLFVHGYFFDDIGGADRKYLAALDVTTGEATAWNPDLSFWPSAIVESDGILYVGGNFTTVDGESRPRLAAFDTSTGALTDWNPGANDDVLALAVAEGVIYAGGRFTEVDGSPQPYLAGLDATSGDLTAWNPDVGDLVNRIVVADSTLYIGGSFSQVGGAIRVAVAEVHRTTGLPTPWDIEWTGLVNDIAVYGDTVFVGGSHNFIEPITVQRLHYAAAFDRTTGLRIDWDPAPHEEVFEFEFGDGMVMVAGEFASIGGENRFFVAALDGNTGRATDWSPMLSRRAFEVVPTESGDTLFVGGSFTHIDQIERGALAAFETATGAMLDWNPDVTDDVREIIIDGQTIYVSGSIDTIGQLVRGSVGAIDRATGAPIASFDAGISTASFANALALSGDTLYVGGSFSMVGMTPRTGVAALDKTTGAVLDWDPDPDGGTEELYLLDHPSFPNGVIFVGGNFNNIGGTFRPGLAAIDRTTGNALSWNASLQESFSRAVHTIAVSGNTMFIGGTFAGTHLNESSNLAAVDVATGDDLPWTPDANGSLRALALTDSTIAAGGFFTTIGTESRARIAVLSLETGPPLPPTALTATPSATVDRRIDLAWTASSSPEVVGYRIYRSTASIADTTGLRIATTGIATSYADITPDYDTYHYVVFAVNGTGEVSPASNEASAESPEVSSFAVTTSILQNPALSSHVDVTVVSTEALAEAPGVVVRRDVPMESSDVEMRPIAGSSTSFIGSHVFSDGGTYSIDTDVVPVEGDAASFTRSFMVVLGDPGRPVEVPTTDGLAMLRVPEGAYAGLTFFLSEVLPPHDTTTSRGDGSSPTSPIYRFGPAGRFPGASVEIRYDASDDADPGKLLIQRLEGGTWEPLPSRVYPNESAVRAATDRAGRFRLVHDPASPGDNTAPAAFVVGRNRPNPFRPFTTIEYALPDDGPVRIEVYDLGGRRVATLFDGRRVAGRHEVAWHGRTDAGTQVAGGVYFLRIVAGSHVATRKMTLTR